MAEAQPDVVVTNHGSIITLALKTQAAREWVDENVPDDAPYFGGQLAVEPRFFDNLVGGMEGDGLVVA